MFKILGPLTIAYLAGSGLATNACVVGRGLFRAAGEALKGNFGNAGQEAAAAIAAPAVMTYAAAANLVEEVVVGANSLIGGLLDHGEEEPGLEMATTFRRECEAECR
jgi:hypothetical protein